MATFDSLAFVAAALSALTEKHIVTKTEYDRISIEVKSGKNKVYVCAGEVNVVEEIKQTYAKTAQLVAQRHNPSIARNTIALPIGASECENPEIKKYPTTNTKTKKVRSEIKKSGKNKDKPEGKPTKSPPLKTIKWYRWLNLRGNFSLIPKRRNKKEPYKKPNSRPDCRDYERIKENSEISDEDGSQKNEPRKRRLYRKRFISTNEYQRMNANSSDEESLPNMFVDKSTIARKRRTNTSSPEENQVYSDVETRIKLSSVSWKNIQLQGNLEKNKSCQDIHQVYPDFEKDTKQQTALFGDIEIDENLNDPLFQATFDKEPLLTEKAIGRARRVSKKKEKRSKNSSSSEEDTIGDIIHHSDTEVMVTDRLDSLSIASRRVQITAKTIDLFVILPLGGTITIEMESTHNLVTNIKYKIKERVGIAVTEQVLHFGGHLLEDGRSLNEYKIKANSTIHLSVKGRGGAKEDLFFIDSKYLDPEWNYDFTRVLDGSQQFTRGGYPYYRPCGWNRIAIKVLGKYQNDIWLGKTGGGSKGEWAVTYHGTNSDVFNNIANEGYIVGNGDAFGRGVYSTPKIDKAARYASPFNYDGINYIGVFQNRVNPRGVNFEYNGHYWVCPDEDDVRPYGLCVKKVK